MACTESANLPQHPGPYKEFDFSVFSIRMCKSSLNLLPGILLIVCLHEFKTIFFYSMASEYPTTNAASLNGSSWT
ncbi:hypothetical protein PSHT_03167 [Puccinia striiformis]|uniref:Uncharacterized protein n=1 Tax=Puccinia striiformis TaxID=27350 RepID=A0A2S4WG57_9BASI|nr:hypothetical protein PSHT_03167 [Puccinia striiformis]